MSNDVLTESRESGTHNRSPLTWLVAAAAAVIIAGVGIFAVVNGLSGSDDPSVRSPAPTRPPTPARIRVQRPHGHRADARPGQEAYAARCMVPNAAAPVDQRRSPSTGTVESGSPTGW